MSAIVLYNDLPVVYPTVSSYRPTGNKLAFKRLQQSTVAQSPDLFPLHERLGEISRLPTDWDSHGSVSPNSLAIDAARQFIEDTYRQAHSVEVTEWQKPHISSSEDGEVVFEWWNGSRKLTIYVGPRELTYIKSWGPNVQSDMEDGEVSENGMPSLWGWLFG